MTAITLTDVGKRYGSTDALNGLTFEVARGEMFGLIGPDGAGKTTAIRLMCGLLHPDRGSLRVMDLDPVKNHKALTHKVGYLSQRFSLYGDLTIDENIAFFAEIHGVTDYVTRRNHLLEMTQLTRFRDRLADKLSGGMKQKLALACTLVHQPEVVLLDEPTTGVDPVSRREFWKLLSHFLESGITILMTTPYLDEAERCNRVALVHDGRTLALDTPANLRTSLPGVWIESFSTDARGVRNRLRAAGHQHVEVFGERLHLWLPAAADEAAAVQALAALAAKAGLPPIEGRVITPSLEDVFIARLAELAPATPAGALA
ncbi:MAG TPA: ABC transporter ATP-binding protein [Vicinamibacterales bacterium]|nr:ABC transporter ATP-binding protein [Vicinamibacterales bacterium]